MTTNNELNYKDVDAIFRRLRALKATFGFKPNKDHRAAVLIGACISERFDTRGQIVGALKRLMLPQAHIVIILERHNGDDPKHHMWKLAADGRYRLLDDESACVV